MLDAFFERINELNAIYMEFSAIVASFDDLYMMTHYFDAQPVARALLILHQLIIRIKSMIQILQQENNAFETILNLQIRDSMVNCKLMLISKHHSGWNEFMQCQKFIVPIIHPLALYNQFAADIEQHTNIVREYCTLLAGFLDEARVLDTIIPWYITDDPVMLNIAEIMCGDCIRIFRQTESHYFNQLEVRCNIITISIQFYSN